jgi:hypothetical protein
MPSEGQLTGPVVTQSCVALQVSAPLQNTPSSQNESLGAWRHALWALLHESAVQSTLSLQLGGVPAMHPCDGEQTSAPLQNRPSLQAALLGV